jgi:pimeloyl-ACP methyl ester carboxylesterase
VNTNSKSPVAEATSTQFLDRGEGRIAYDVTGTGPLIICVPGMGALRSSFRYNTGVLAAAGFRVAAMDLRGHGDSDATFSAYDDEAAGADAAALIRHLGGGPALVIGNSMGGASAVWVTVDDPGLVAGLVLVDALARPQPASLLTTLGQRVALARPWARPAWASYRAAGCRGPARAGRGPLPAGRVPGDCQPGPGCIRAPDLRSRGLATPCLLATGTPRCRAGGYRPGCSGLATGTGRPRNSVSP